MATIEELEAQAATIGQAEAAATYALAEAMRELAVNLPDGSRSAVDLANEAGMLDTLAGGSSPGSWGTTTIRSFVLRAYDERRDVLPVEEED